MAEPVRMSAAEIKNLFDLTGKTVVITGAGGALGSTLAKGLALHGADIVTADMSLSLLEKVVADVKEAGRKALPVEVNVVDEESAQSMIDMAVTEFGKVDVLITVAGIADRHPAEDFPIDIWQKVMDVNVKGTFICAQKAGKQMIEQGKGKIITIGSVRGFLGHPGGYAAYGTSKGSVHLLTQQLATEWAKYKINVNSIAPCIFWTPLTQQVLDDKKLYEIFMSRIPWGRAATPDDFIGTAVYLSSAASDFVTGVILSVDGGSVAG